jgi:hypothetical protein
VFLANLSKREKLFVYLAGALLFFSLIYKFVFAPVKMKWGALNNRIVDREIELKKNIRYLQQENDVKTLYLKYADYLKRKGSDEEEINSLILKGKVRMKKSWPLSRMKCNRRPVLHRYML